MPLKSPIKPGAPHLSFPSPSASSAGIRRLSPPRAAMDSSSESDLEDDPTMRLPPTLMWRLLSALFYAVPWIDSVMLGYPMFGALPSLVPLYFAPAPLTKIFFCHPYAPLAIFFLMYLAVVRNQRLHHFVRFHCMQATMIDILAMMFMIAAAFFPAQFKASWLFEALNSFGFTTMMIFVLFSIVSALMGYYADIPLLSDSAYHQITIAEYAP
ncbi:hypothetical protein H632_c356p1 [Helicosporidium sp. ATCC 50920]|nr:hypothetical protein H632_c356p1 [Helicosporidium sp. ATCC 50920]|eukprot:KDD76100.1 hypothetical protein H632_c356p1 [Helicosporidium sp. ATCC 50920]